MMRGTYVTILLVFAIFAVQDCKGFTDPRDVFAINSLYTSLGYPLLPGWVPYGLDPCGDKWHGVLCVNSNVTAIVLNDSNLGGELSEGIGSFASIIQINLSNNHIGGSIPSNLPVTVKTLSLSGNQLTGSIPDTISSLGQLSDLSLNNNHLNGVIPDAFQQLKSLINMDLSGNSLSGQLPPSMGNLPSLITLHLQNNQLSGILDVLQDLALTDLNIENNLFSGPIPSKLLSIPTFRRAGNPFNTTIIPSPPVISPSPAPFAVLSPDVAPSQPFTVPSGQGLQHSGGQKSSNSTKHVKVIAIAGLLTLVILGLGVCLLMSRFLKRRRESQKETKRHHAYSSSKGSPKHDHSVQKPYYDAEKEAGLRPVTGNRKAQGNISMNTSEAVQHKGMKSTTSYTDDDLDSEMESTVSDILPPPPPPFLSALSAERMVVNPILPPITSVRHAMKNVNSAEFFTIASLQQYTNSFSQDNLIGGGMLGTVYRAESPKKLLAVKKLDTAVTRRQSDQEFVGMVSNISGLKHENIVKLVGYCSEHGQRLLVYEYCRYGTLHEALHLDDEIHRKLSWSTRVRIAHQAARALEYLHEVCHPPIVHQNFKSANVLLDDELAVHISDCGLAPLMSSDSTTQLQGCGYGAPELELGSYSCQSDVYSFGVVMLELLTGRKSYDRSRPRGEQLLVRWAIPRLHDIDALSRMVDPSLNGSYPSKSLSRFADIISLCIQSEPEFRPPMSEIVQNLLHMI
ncbi:protein STRUBBELIG-RECEPTOR FAMILY 3-like isoform X1 [Nicotiana sylvestris]|uniref:Protein STRUBBELIG-RECEPTOR FAMILY 3 n=2 Tax=Nicotiana TaxID=4085 RepID=A0A1S4CQ22_TOBAC|nr:PREDICTED: protein STRUBBELIG-RECEPTOR FAMILY 3-like isoform X1 [Nicotiana sylvestris]XP_009789816.1 PREDICTED: protein STRUBBELIG-RECEPTOR FAMILY 3-like isoform X1 [Nicotiana sylvestris]XP_009789817.1 PREDICTED: protein STRUBBELIG-RECEPTOR FAMILY 3-like isoform X1 [Nicotiana sylvestris]XP_016503165.1 PREDICTED: protein STRUBBELIG-RECEPTOR FAMILY 3-like [Nicotiana tabacum]